VVALWSGDVTEGDWIVERLHPFAQDVGSLIPEGFAAYARVLHPLDSGVYGASRWAEVASRNGRIAHRVMQLHRISRQVGDPEPNSRQRAGGVEWGSLPADELQALASVLGRHSSASTGCWFGVWDGYGQLHGSPAVARLSSTGEGGHVAGIAPPEVLSGPRLRVPGREYLLLRGPLSSVSTLQASLGGQSPNLWWPATRTWCVATEIDLAWTYVGGSAALIAHLLADQRLEVLPAESSDGFTYDSDLLNGD
jgi:hypothetical protein